MARTSPVTDSPQPPRIAAIICAVLELEIEHLGRKSANLVHIEKLEQGLHNEPDRLRIEVQQAIDRCEQRADVDAIVLGYGLCSRGTEGAVTKRCQLVIPRAHDCITLLIGSKQRYQEYVDQNPGTYWYSPGWNKHHIPPGQERYEKYYNEYKEKYGEDNAQYLMETEQAWFSHYDRATFVDIGVSPTDEDQQYTRDCAAWLNWRYDRVQGNGRLIENLLTGQWNEDEFLVLEPGKTLKLTGDDRIVASADPQDIKLP